MPSPSPVIPSDFGWLGGVQVVGRFELGERVLSRSHSRSLLAADSRAAVREAKREATQGHRALAGHRAQAAYRVRAAYRTPVARRTPAGRLERATAVLPPVGRAESAERAESARCEGSATDSCSRRRRCATTASP